MGKPDDTYRLTRIKNSIYQGACDALSALTLQVLDQVGLDHPNLQEINSKLLEISYLYRLPLLEEVTERDVDISEPGNTY